MHRLPHKHFNQPFRWFFILFSAFLLSACPSDDDTPASGSGTTSNVTNTRGVLIFTDSPQISSDGSQEATIRVTVRDAQNRAIEGQFVDFEASSGTLFVDQPITDEDGEAIATLGTVGESRNRSIRVTARARGSERNIDIQVAGTTLTITGPPGLIFGEDQNYIVRLEDSAGNGVANALIQARSANGNPIGADSFRTDSEGRVFVNIQGQVEGTDRVTVSGFGLETSRLIRVSDDLFEFIAPEPDIEVPLGTTTAVSLLWQNPPPNVPVTDSPVQFTISRGEILDELGNPIDNSNPPRTDSEGRVTVFVRSSIAGPAIITATSNVDQVLRAELDIEFVAELATSLNLQAEPSSIAVGGRSEIIAVVRDAASNPVKNARVSFRIVRDSGGGRLLSGLVETDSQGRARTTYVSNASTGANGVTIEATVLADNNTASDITDFVDLTVGGTSLGIGISTGNQVEVDDNGRYTTTLNVQVVDSAGNPQRNRRVSLSITPSQYFKGIWRFSDALGRYALDVRASCDPEDQDRDGILDAGEDFNGNGVLDPSTANLTARFVPSASTPPSNNSSGGSILTDDNGNAFVQVTYPRALALALRVRFTVTTVVDGSEFSDTLSQLLQAVDEELEGVREPDGDDNPNNDADNPIVPPDNDPPGVFDTIPAPLAQPPGPAGEVRQAFISPFGYEDNCALPD